MDEDESMTTSMDTAPHDHAWRKISTNEPGSPLVLGAYRCDLCDEIWFL